jgi:hypothetical protein
MKTEYKIQVINTGNPPQHYTIYAEGVILHRNVYEFWERNETGTMQAVAYFPTNNTIITGIFGICD